MDWKDIIRSRGVDPDKLVIGKRPKESPKTTYESEIRANPSLWENNKDTSKSKTEDDSAAFRAFRRFERENQEFGRTTQRPSSSYAQTTPTPTPTVPYQYASQEQRQTNGQWNPTIHGFGDFKNVEKAMPVYNPDEQRKREMLKEMLNDPLHSPSPAEYGATPADIWQVGKTIASMGAEGTARTLGNITQFGHMLEEVNPLSLGKALGMDTYHDKEERAEDAANTEQWVSDIRSDLGVDYENMNDAIKMVYDVGTNIPSMAAGPVVFATSAAGGYAQDAESKGASPLKSVIFGTLGGMAEFTLEALLGVVPGFKNFAGKGLLKNIGGEFIEEALTDPVINTLEKIIFNPNKEVWELDKMLESGTGGGIMATMLSLLGMPGHFKSRQKAEQLVNSGQEVTPEQAKELILEAREEVQAQQQAQPEVSMPVQKVEEQPQPEQPPVKKAPVFGPLAFEQQQDLEGLENLDEQELAAIRYKSLSDVAPEFDSQTEYFGQINNGRQIKDANGNLMVIPWKLHVTATPENATDVYNTVKPVLSKKQAIHKIVKSENLLEKLNTDTTQAGKFITIYATSEEELQALAQELDAVLDGKGFNGPKIPTDRPVGKSGMVFARNELADREVGKYKPDNVQDIFEQPKQQAPVQETPALPENKPETATGQTMDYKVGDEVGIKLDNPNRPGETYNADYYDKITKIEDGKVYVKKYSEGNYKNPSGIYEKAIPIEEFEKGVQNFDAGQTKSQFNPVEQPVAQKQESIPPVQQEAPTGQVEATKVEPVKGIAKAAQARRDKTLNQVGKYNGKTMTRKQFIEQSISEGQRIEAVELKDHAAIEKLNNEMAAIKKDYIPGLSNPNTPKAKRYNEIKAMLDKGVTKTEYRVYDSKDKNSYHPITKTEYDYAMEIKAAEKAKESEPTPAPTPENQYEQYKSKRDEWNDRANNTQRLQILGTEKTGVRISDAEETGKVYEMYEKGEITLKEWDAYVDNLIRENRISDKSVLGEERIARATKPAVETKAPEPQPVKKEEPKPQPIEEKEQPLVEGVPDDFLSRDEQAKVKELKSEIDKLNRKIQERIAEGHNDDRYTDGLNRVTSQLKELSGQIHNNYYDGVGNRQIDKNVQKTISGVKNKNDIEYLRENPPEKPLYPKSYFVLLRDLFFEVKGSPVENNYGLDLFVHKGAKGSNSWVVSEGKTGLAIYRANDKETRQSAIDNALKTIEKAGIDKLNELIKGSFTTVGASPRYIGIKNAKFKTEVMQAEPKQEAKAPETPATETVKEQPKTESSPAADKELDAKIKKEVESAAFEKAMEKMGYKTLEDLNRNGIRTPNKDIRVKGMLLPQMYTTQRLQFDELVKIYTEQLSKDKGFIQSVKDKYNADKANVERAKQIEDSFSKEDWQVPQDIILERGSRYVDGKDVLVAHKEAVQKALSEGKPVPQEVLKDYPELAKEEAAEPWQMSQNEYVNKKVGDKPKWESDIQYKAKKADALNEWYSSVEQAFIEGKQTKVKPAWAKTLKEFAGDDIIDSSITSEHKEIVQKAISEGKPVPQEILKDYPELSVAEEPKITAENFMDTVKPEDVDYKRAYSAHHATSFEPEVRAKQEQNGYVTDIKNVYDELLPLAKTDEQKAVLVQELQRFKEAYLNKNNALLDAKSRTMSSMITGPAKFPTARNQKALDVEHKRSVEFMEWFEKAQKSIAKKLKSMDTPETVDSAEHDRLKKEAIRVIGILKGIENGEPYDPALIRSNFVSKLKRSADNGHTEAVRQVLEFIKAEEGKHLKSPVFAKNNSIWQYAENAESKQAETPTGIKTVATYDGAEIVNNYDEDRTQIFFDEKPSNDVTSALRNEGWHWRPSAKAWQRKLNNAAEYSSKSIVSKFYKAKASTEKAVSDEPLSEIQDGANEKQIESPVKTNASNEVLEAAKETASVVDDDIVANPIEIYATEELPDDINALLKIQEAYSKLTKEEKKTIGVKMDLQHFAEKLKKAIRKFATNTAVKHGLSQYIDIDDFVHTVLTEATQNEQADNNLQDDREGTINRIINADEHDLDGADHSDVKAAFKVMDEIVLNKDGTLKEKLNDKDASLFRKLARGAAHIGTAGGRIVQAFAEFARRSVNGMIMIAQNAVNDAEEGLSKTQKDKIEDETKELEKVIQTADKEAIDDVGREMDAEQEDAEDEEDSSKLSNLLASRIKAHLKVKNPKTIDFVDKVVNDLFRKAVDESPIKGPKTPDTRQQEAVSSLALAIKNNPLYREVWENAKETLKKYYKKKGNQAALDALDAYFDKGIRPPFPLKQLDSAISLQLKKMNTSIGDMVRKYYEKGSLNRKKLVEALVKQSRLTDAEAQRLADYIDNRVKEQLKEYRDEALKNMFKKRPPVKKDAAERLETIANYGGFLNKKYADKVMSKVTPAIRKLFKENGIDFNEIARSTIDVAEDTKIKLLNQMAKELKVDDGDLKTLLNAIQSEYDNLTINAKQKLLNQLFGTWNRPQPKSFMDKLKDLLDSGAFDRADLRDLIKEKYGLPTLNNEDIKFIAERMGAYEKTTDIKKQNAIYESVLNYLGEKLSTKTMEKLNGWRKTAMLLNFKTHERNILSNVVMSGMYKASDALAQALEKAFVPDKYKTKSIFWRKDKNLVKLVEEAWKQQEYNIRSNDKYESSGNRNMKSLIERHKRIFKTNWMHKIHQKSYEWLETEDLWFLRPAFKDALGQFMSARKLTEVTPEALEYAKNVAYEITLKQNNKLSKLISQAKHGRGGAFLDALIPFSKTPANILQRAWEFSPGGLIQFFAQKVFYKTDPEIWVNSLAKGLTGSALFLFGWVLSKLGLATGARDERKDVEDLKVANGIQPWAIKLFGGTYTMDWIQPGAMPFMMGVAFNDALDKTKNPDLIDTIFTAATSGGDTLLNMSMLRNIKSVIDNEGSFMEAVYEIPLSYLEQFLPTMIAQAVRGTDPNRRSTMGDNDLESFGMRMMSKLPGASLALPEMYDNFGRPLKNQSLASNLFSPGFWASGSDDPVVKEVYRVFKQEGDAAAVPDRIFRSVEAKYRGQSRTEKLTPQEIKEYQVKVGQEIYERLQREFDKASYQRKDSDKQSERIAEIIKDITDEHREDFKDIVKDRMKEEQE